MTASNTQIGFYLDCQSDQKHLTADEKQDRITNKGEHRMPLMSCKMFYSVLSGRHWYYNYSLCQNMIRN